MFTEMLAGLGQLTPEVLFYVFVGVLLTQFIVVIPGLGGTFALAILLPFLTGADPLVAVALMVAAVASDGTGNCVTSILFGVPGSSTGVATIFDGHPMAKAGLAGRALGASLGAAAVGGILGAIVLALLIPILAPIVLSFGSAEFFVLIVLGLTAIGAVRGESLVKGLLAAALGLALAFVGQEQSTGELRYTFGHLYLWDGIQLVPFMIGLFAVSEAIDMIARGSSIAAEKIDPEVGGARQGVLDVFRHPRATIRSSVVGVLVGLVPGLGGSAAQFMAYASVRQASDDPASFGKGNVEGVIAADASTNAKDGGSLVPTMAFGIPGSSGMAILLAGLLLFGFQPGPNMFEEDLDVLWMVVFILVVANLFATGLLLSVANWFAKLTHVRVSFIASIVLCVSMFGAYTATSNVGDLWTVAALGFVGYFMNRYGYSRAAFVAAFVLGPLLESSFQLSLQLYGAAFLLRPVALGIVAVAVAASMFSRARRFKRMRRVPRRSGRAKDAREDESDVEGGET